jgi:hypothetical protein
MGLLSSSYKYYAYAGSASLFDEDARPNTVKQLMLNGIIDGNAGPAEAIVIGLNTNMYARARSMFKYAGREDGYKWAYPTTNQDIYNISVAMVRPYVEADAGGPVDFRTLNWGPFDPTRQAFFIEMSINQTYLDTDYFNWTIGDPEDTNWSPVDDSVEIPVVIPGVPPAPDTYAISDNQYEVDITGSLYQVTFPYEGGTYDVEQPYDLSPYEEGIWICVRYRDEGAEEQYKYWAYQIGSNKIPALEAAIERAQLLMEYLPIAVLMHDEAWFDEVNDEEYENTLDRLLKRLALDPYDIKEDYLENQAESEQERGDAKDFDFFVHFAIPLKTRDRGGREYLFYLYEWLRTRSTWTTFEEYQAYISGSDSINFFVFEGSEQPHSHMSIEEGEEYTGYIARFAWSYIERKDVDGPFTPPNWVEPLRPRRCWSNTYKLDDDDYNFGLDLVHGEGNYAVALGQFEGQEHSYTIVTRMNEDNTHTHILMMGPSMEYQVNTSKEPVGEGPSGYVDYRYRFVDVELFPDDPEQDSEFRWPIHLGTLKEVSVMQREAALSDGLCATVFLVEEQEVKFYQKGFFKWLIIIIIVVIVILAWQYNLLPTLYALATAATGATALALWALYVVVSFALGFLISFAGNLIGGPLGQIFVIVSMVLVAGGNLSSLNPFSNVTSAWQNFVATPGWGSAIPFINSVSTIVRVGQVVYGRYKLHKLEEEMEDFIMTAREKHERLQDAWDSLGETPDWIDPLDLATTFANAGLYEDPTSFYYRTLHANPGSLGYDLIENFTEMALMLPKNPGSPTVVDSMIDQFARQRRQV